MFSWTICKVGIQRGAESRITLMIPLTGQEESYSYYYLRHRRLDGSFVGEKEFEFGPTNFEMSKIEEK